VTIARGLRCRTHLLAFIGSCLFLAGLLAATAAAVFPVMLRATGGDALSLTAYNASAAHASLRIAVRWWLVGIPLVVVYFATVFRIHRGKATAAVGREGY
jgi:cytochrome d ubiquinol oxidase subunit II